MGYNTTVVVMNDALGMIEGDPNFGKNLARAIAEVGRGKPVDVPASNGRGVHCNAATVIESHHADYDVYVRVGQNFGEAMDLEMMQEFLQWRAKRQKRSTVTVEAQRK